MEHMLRSMEQLDQATVEHVLRAMKHADVTLDALATRTGISKSALTRRLAGETSFTVRELGLLARALNCRTWELVGEKEIGPNRAIRPGPRFGASKTQTGAKT
jgi:transcriptional regulator with XRE-family HTH domain